MRSPPCRHEGRKDLDRGEVGEVGAGAVAGTEVGRFGGEGVVETEVEAAEGESAGDSQKVDDERRGQVEAASHHGQHWGGVEVWRVSEVSHLQSTMESAKG